MSKLLIVVLALLIAVGFSVVVANTIDGEELRLTVAVVGALLLSVGTLTALDRIDNDGPPTAH